MMMKNKSTLTPKLRFPEFRDELGWEEVPLEQIAERTTTKNFDGSIARVLTNSAEHGIVDQRDYFDKDIANAGNIDGYYIVDLGDYVYNPRISNFAPVGPISRNNIGKGVMSPLYTVFRFAEEITDFYQYYFKTASWHFYLRRLSSMGARHDRMSITTGDFMAMPVPTPPAKEQQKIAECLGSLDGLIAAEGQKLEALRDHKRGLMQQLFPQPGQTRPRLRFPEFRDKGEWVESTVGSKCKCFSGSTPDTTRKEFYGGTIPFIRSAEIGSDNIGMFLTEEGFDSSAAKMVARGDVLVALYGANSGDVALARVDGAINQAILCLRPEGSKAFLYHYLTHKKAWILATYLQGGQGNLSGEIVKSVSLRFPLPEEQETVAACLTTLDTRIAAQAAKIETLKQHKRGLMQQLFPAPEDQ